MRDFRAIGLLLPLLAACVSTNGPSVQDTNSFLWTVRATEDPWGERKDPTGRERPDGIFEDGEAGMAGAHGSAEGFSYDTFQTWLAGRYGGKQKNIDAVFLGGVVFNHFEARRGNQGFRSNRVGLMGGGQLDVYFARMLRFYGRGTWSWLPSGADANSTLAEVGIGIDLSGLELLLGYGYWDYRQENDVFGGTKFEMSGFLLGAEFAF
jgi:hypothetical protein